MLTKFSVSNFKGFNSELVFDLKDTNAYAFNTDSIKNGVVNNALVYGPNGVGKSNLGFAIFDIIAHLTDKRIDESQYLYYLNALNESDSADFQYEFQFDSNTVIYKYKKTQYDIVIFESFSINEKELAFIDKKKNNEAKVGFKGTESLKTNMTDQNLSLLKYIKNNSVLVENEENNCFEKFFVFVDRMLFFRSLKENMYLGLQIGKKTLDEDIIEKGNVADLQAFLNSAGVDCKLTVIKESDKDVIAFDFNGKTIAYYRIASSGTHSLVLFYYWLQRLRVESKVSFVFIDEFDAFYHHDLSALIVKKLKETGIQFFLTTHNTSIMSNDVLRPDCYFLMYNNSIKSLARYTSKELREAHNIEKMYKAGTFNDE